MLYVRQLSVRSIPFSICFSQSLSLFSTSVYVLSLFIHCNLHTIQSGSQLSVNQEVVDPLMVPGSPVCQAETAPSLNADNGSVDTLLTSGYATPSCTPLPLELHIDEDSAPASSPRSTVVEESKSLQYSQLEQMKDGGCVASEISHVESLSISNTTKPCGKTEVNSTTHISVTKVSTSKVSSPPGKSSSPVTVGRSSSPASATRSLSPAVGSKSPSPILRAKSPSPPDLKCSPKEFKSPSPIPKTSSPSPVSHSPEGKTASPATVRKLSSPVLKSASPVTVPTISSPVTVPKAASPEPVPKSASPVSFPRLSSPVPKVASPVTVPNIESSSPETLSKSPSPIILPRLSSPVTVPKIDSAAPKSPAPVTKKTWTNSPRASPVQLANVASGSISSTPSEKQGSEILDLTWPCREPLLDDALDKLLSPDPTLPSGSQTPASALPGDEDRSWEEEDGIYPDLSREGTLTPMTESSWIDECYTPSTCPGTPDATLDLPSQQPSAVERLSASGQVGRST